MPGKSNPIVSAIDKKIDTGRFREQHCEGSFGDYLEYPDPAMLVPDPAMLVVKCGVSGGRVCEKHAAQVRPLNIVDA